MALSQEQHFRSYEPDWDHSTRLELVIWGAPLLIIIALGLLTWITTHTLDPYRPLSRIDAERPLSPQVKPLVVEVVALDWKWLFIYPEQGIATVNELAAPVDAHPVQDHCLQRDEFLLHPGTGRPDLRHAGMETKLHAVINKAGEYDGFSANYSGAGFSHMRFKFHGLDQAGFDAWVQKAKAGAGKLTVPST
jgi:cytochrome o ubiquinol oxidase subunit 2